MHAGQRASLDAGPEQRLGQLQVQEILLRAIGQLSPDHRAVVDLTYFHEIGYREIAEIMDCPVDTVNPTIMPIGRIAAMRSSWLWPVYFDIAAVRVRALKPLFRLDLWPGHAARPDRREQYSRRVGRE